MQGVMSQLADLANPSTGVLDSKLIEARTELVKIRAVRTAVVNAGRDSSGKLNQAAESAVEAVENVLRNLHSDPSDLDRVRLSLELLNPTARILARCEIALNEHADSSHFQESLKASIEALNLIRDKFVELSSGRLKVNDSLDVETLSGMLRELAEKA